MTLFKGGKAIKGFLEEFDSWLSESVTVYLLGGSAMTEAQQIRDRSHPLFAIEMAVNSFSGLPSTFTSRIEEFIHTLWRVARQYRINQHICGTAEIVG